MNPMDTNDRFSPTRIFRIFKVNAWLIGLAVILASTLAFMLSRSQKPRYECVVDILSAATPTGNSGLNGQIVTASPLPQGAFAQTLGGAPIIETILKDAELAKVASAEELEKLGNNLHRQVVERKLEDMAVRGRTDLSGNGTYELSAFNGNPLVCAALANAATRAMIDWDTDRARLTVRQSIQPLQNQLRLIETQIESTRPGFDRDTLNAQRTSILAQLGGLRSNERSAVPTLTVLAPAVPSYTPVSPKPTRDSLLTALVALLVTSSIVIFRAEVNRKANDETDLKQLDLRLLGKLPRVPMKRGATGLQTVLEMGKNVDDVAFVRANLNVLLSKTQPKIILITSPMPGDGKSSVCATLAESFAAAGQRTLIIDADLRRAGQQSIWSHLAQTSGWVSLPGASPIPVTRSGAAFETASPEDLEQDGRQYHLRSALAEPEKARARKLQEKLHYIPAGPPTWRSAEILTMGTFSAAIKRWGTGYDVILIDSPPALAVADPVLIAPLTSGVVLVIEPGRTTYEALERLIDSLRIGRAPILGAVFNRVNPRQRERYTYYPPKGQAVVTGPRASALPTLSDEVRSSGR